MSNSKSVLITGCSSGIGKALSYYLKTKGWTVYPTTKEDDEASLLRDEGFESFKLDIRSKTSIDAALENILKKSNGHIDALINNAGFELIGAIEDLPLEAIRQQFETNVFGALEITKALIPIMRKHNNGKILFIGSAACSRVSFPFSGAYCASKHALGAFVDALRREIIDSKISITIIDPGPFKSKAAKNSEEIFAKYIDAKRSRYGSIYNKMFANFKKIDEALSEKKLTALAKLIYNTLESKHPKIRIITPRSPIIYEIIRRFFPYKIQDFYLFCKMRFKDKII